MKKLFLTLLAGIAPLAFAHSPGHPSANRHYHYYHRSNIDWIVPAMITGAVVYATTRPAPTPPPTVIYVPQGYPLPPQGFRYEQIVDAGCNCARWVLVQGQ